MACDSVRFRYKKSDIVRDFTPYPLALGLVDPGNRNLSPESPGCLSGVISHDAVANNQDSPVAHSQNLTELNAPAAVKFRQIIAANQRRHVARNGAHRRENRKSAELVL